MADRPPRPQALTLTCIFVGVGCALLLVNLVSALSSWGSIALQDAVRDTLAQEPLRELDVSVDQALEWLRYGAYVAVVLTASGAVFSVYAARGHRVSRVMLSVLCGLAFLAFAALGLPGLLPALFAGLCGWSLWSADARRWYDQVDGRAVPAAAMSAQSASVRSSSRPSDPFAAVPPSQVPELPPTSTAPIGTDPAVPPAPPAAAAAARPRSVTAALVTTVVSCSVVGLFGLVTLLVSTVGADAYRSALTEPGLGQDMLRSSGIEPDQVIGLLRISSAVWLVLSLAGLAAALATARRSAVGVATLRLVAAFTVGVSVFFLPLGIVTGAAAIVVIVQLRRADARAWFAGA